MSRDEPVERTGAEDRDKAAAPVASDLVFSRSERRGLIHIAHRWLGNAAEAEDIVQEVYLRALSAAEHQALSPAWLAVSVRHLSIDRLRRRRHEPVTSDAMESAQTGSAPEQATEVREALHHLLARVNGADAALLLLHAVFEFSQVELAALSGLGEAALRQRLHRGLQRLRGERPAQDEAADATLRETLYRLCSQAVTARDPSALLHLLTPQQTVALAGPASTAPAAGSAPRSTLVQAAGSFALAVSLDGVLLCTVPVGVLAPSEFSVG